MADQKYSVSEMLKLAVQQGLIVAYAENNTSVEINCGAGTVVNIAYPSLFGFLREIDPTFLAEAKPEAVKEVVPEVPVPKRGKKRPVL